ncbi:hypothetical protein AYO44_17300 [Planctomycetaceae bacterium SCGC AG-212-F19]|nr:hypothetical protein AYO44_17300 [Planctomycetaceae bacterium SCGC AG-212-F19]
MIQRALAPQGARITESALVDVPGISEGREIDILIETEVGPYHIKIAVEAKDEGRKMDSTKFESLLGKYNVEGGVKVNKVVIVTHQGCYQPVIDRAKLLGIELYTLEQIKDSDWSKFFPQQMRFRMPPHICGIEVEPPIAQDIFNDLLSQGEVFCSHGQNHGTLAQFVMSHCVRGMLQKQPTLFADLEKMAAGPTGQAKANIAFNPDHPHFIRLRGQDYQMTSLNFGIHMVNASGVMEYSMCQLRDSEGKATDVPLGEVELAGKRIRLLMPQGMKSPNIIVHIDSK